MISATRQYIASLIRSIQFATRLENTRSISYVGQYIHAMIEYIAGLIERERKVIIRWYEKAFCLEDWK